MGKLEYQQTWIILLTTRPKRGKSNIDYVTVLRVKSSKNWATRKSPAKWEGPVSDHLIKEFDSYDLAKEYSSKNLDKFKYCITICPSFKKPKLVRDRKEWAKSWQQVLWKHAPETSACGKPRRRKRRSGAVAARRDGDLVRPADAGLGAIS